LRLVLHTLDLLVLDVESLRVHFKSQTAFLENLLTFAHSFFLLQILCKIYLSILSSHDLLTLWLLMILLRSLIVLDQLIYAVLTISLLASRSTLEDFLSCLVVVLSHQLVGNLQRLSLRLVVRHLSELVDIMDDAFL
jgi:hypothetical protein